MRRASPSSLGITDYTTTRVYEFKLVEALAASF